MTQSIRNDNKSVDSLYETIIKYFDIALVLIDAVEGMTDQDVKIAGLAFEEGKACIIVVNKWDSVEKDTATVGKYVLDMKDKSKFLDFAPIIFVSALSGQRVMKIFDIIKDVYQEYTKRIGTGEFNRVCRKIIDRNPPPVHLTGPTALPI